MHQRGKLPHAEAGARRHRHEQHGQLLALLPGARHEGLFRTVGYGGDSGSIKDIENAGLVLIIGSNTAESHPVLATRVKQAHKLRGQKLIVADLRKHEMAERADLFFQPKPGHRPRLALRHHPLHPGQRPGKPSSSSNG
jgi:formylmethanofuran dehydrogenase subunit B